jgi:probable HAF family extracellular repeat protein
MDTRQVVARFEAERQALALMDHPNIAKVFDGGTTPSGRPYFVMEQVKGTPVSGSCGNNHLTIRQRLPLFVSVCQAVQHAHQKGIIHRDLNPFNVLVLPHNTIPVAKVIDFGIAPGAGADVDRQDAAHGRRPDDRCAAVRRLLARRASPRAAHRHGFLYTDSDGDGLFSTGQGTIADLGTLGGGTTEATAINAAGQVVGDSVTSKIARDGYPNTDAFLWTPAGANGTAGTMKDLGALPRASGVHQTAVALAVNDSATVVGWSYAGTGTRAAFVWTAKGGLKDLNGLITAKSGWASLEWASGVNNRGGSWARASTVPDNFGPSCWCRAAPC